MTSILLRSGALALRAVSLVVLSLAAAPSQAAVVALFADTGYVDYNVGDLGAEASNLEASLADLGHTVNTFTGTATGDWSTALAGVDVLAIPEQESGAIYPDLDPGAVTAIQDFVSNGGSLIISEDYRDFLNDTFGWGIATSGSAPYDLVTANAAGTSFEGGPSSLPSNNATASYTNLPTGSTCMYENAGSDCVVFTVTYGSGSVISLGWDWYNAAPTGTLDNGWIEVLDRSVAYNSGAVAVQSIPAVGLPALMLLSLALIGFAAARDRRGWQLS